MLTSNPDIKQEYPGLDALLGAAKAIAAKGVATRRLNKAAEAEGKAPLHGQVGKARKKSAKNAAYAQVNGALASSTSTNPTTPSATAPGAGAVTPSPSPATPAPVAVSPVPASPVTAAAMPSTPNGTNGAAHS
jgi:hypothetical protein